MLVGQFVIGTKCLLTLLIQRILQSGLKPNNPVRVFGDYQLLDLFVETLGGAPHQCKWVDNPNFFSDPFEGLPLRTLRGCSPPADADSSENQSH